jgi:hypothetical protein
MSEEYRNYATLTLSSLVQHRLHCDSLKTFQNHPHLCVVQLGIKFEDVLFLKWNTVASVHSHNGHRTFCGCMRVLLSRKTCSSGMNRDGNFRPADMT